MLGSSKYTKTHNIFSSNINSALYISLLKVKQTRSSSKKEERYKYYNKYSYL